MAVKTEGRTSVAGFSDLTVVLWNGGYLIGTLEGGNKLHKPRIVKLEETPKGLEIHMHPPVGLPPFIILNNFLGHYKVPARESVLIDLYNKVTDDKVDPGV